MLPARGLEHRRQRPRARPAARVSGRDCGRDSAFDGKALRIVEVLLGRDVLVSTASEQRDERPEEAGRIAKGQVRVEAEFEQVLAEQHDRLGPRQHARVGRHPELERELADEPVPEGMEGRDPGVREAVRHELVDADLHLGGGLVREREPEDLGWPGPSCRHQPGDPARDDLGLAGPGPRHDQKWPVAVDDGTSLLGVQALEQGVGAGGLDRRLRDAEAGPHRDLLEALRAAPGAPSPDPQRCRGCRRDRCVCLHAGKTGGSLVPPVWHRLSGESTGRQPRGAAPVVTAIATRSASASSALAPESQTPPRTPFA